MRAYEHEIVGIWLLVRAKKKFDPIGQVQRRKFMSTAIAIQHPTAKGDRSLFRRHKKSIEREASAEMQERIAANEDWVVLIAKVRDHQDRAAFAELFRHFAPRVKAFLMKSGATESLAEECAQDVMATLWTKAHMFDPSRASASTWVFTIARNKKIDALRKMRRPEPEDLPWGPEAEPDQADVMSLRQEGEKLQKAIKALPDKQRELVEKAYFGDLSHSEIAEVTGLPLGTIKSRIRLALERLRHAMG